MSYYYNGISAKKVLSVVEVKEVEIDYYVGCATYETEKQDSFIVPQSIEVGSTYFPILENTKTALVQLGGNSVVINQGESNAEIKSTIISKIESVGYNFFDEKTESGAYDTVTGNPTTSPSQIRTKNDIEVIGGKTYTFIIGGTGGLWGCLLDKDKNIISGNEWSSGLGSANNFKVLAESSGGHNVNSFSLPINAKYIRFYFTSGYGTTYNNDVSISLVNLGYKPYVGKLGQINIPNAPITLNGINDIHDLLAFEEQENGTYNAILTRKIGVVDLGTLTWSYNSTNKVHFTSGLASLIKVEDNNKAFNGICKLYVADKINNVYGGVTAGYDKEMGAFTGGSLYIADSSYTTSSDFKTAMNGVNLYYELATPTTEVIATGLTFDEVSTLFEKGGTLKIDNSNTDYIQANSTMAFAVRRFRTTEE